MSELTLPVSRAPSYDRRGHRGRAASWMVLATRAIRLSRRKVDALITSLVLPVLLMLMFVYLFGGAIRTGSGAYHDYVVPGVLVLCAGFGAALTAVAVSEDKASGMIERFRAMDASGAAVLSGQVVASLIRNLASTVLVLGVGLAIGFRPHATVAAWLAAGGIVVAFIVALSWLSAAIGLVAGSPEAASGYTFVLMFLPYPSSAFVPVSSMPAVLRGFARNQPVTPVINAIRNLLAGHPAGSSPWIALAWCAGILVVSVAASGLLFRRLAR